MQTPWRACRGSTSCLPARADRTVSSQGMSETFVGTYDFSNRAGRHKAPPLLAGQGCHSHLPSIIFRLFRLPKKSPKGSLTSYEQVDGKAPFRGLGVS